MPVSTPHGPIHEETEFWYDVEEKALLYEMNFHKESDEAIADHRRTQERRRLIGDRLHDHKPFHREPHGVSFVDFSADEKLKEASSTNAELIVRLWSETGNTGEPRPRNFGREPLILIPKILALFLAAKHQEMHRGDILTQAIPLLHTHIATKAMD